MKQLKATFEFRGVGPPRSTRELIRRFDHIPRNSVTALLRKAGPFDARRDAYRFTNGDPGWPITEEDARALRERYQRHVDRLSVIGIAALRTALSGFTVSVPLAGTTALPVAAIDFVINRVSEDLRNQLLDKVISAFPGRYGRCGGMAFSGYDFFLAGWPVVSFDVKPSSGELRRYIWNRLLDSLEVNAATFFEWVMVLHILPVISKLASAALGAAAGGVIGGPLGAALGAFLAGKDDVLGVGGADDLLRRTREHWGRLRVRLDREAAWPIGLVYANSANPVDQHQVLAIGYEDRGNGTPLLTIWDNNDGARSRYLYLDMRGGELNAAGADHPLKGIICEEYAFKLPPASLRR
jgi:hypothetical protein